MERRLGTTELGARAAALLTALFLVALLATSAHAAGSASSDAIAGEAIIGFDDDATVEQRKAAVNAVGKMTQAIPEIDSALIDLDSGVSARDAEVLQKLPGVAYVEPNYRIQATGVTADPMLLDGLLWGLADMRATTAWNVSTGAGRVVAVIDTGIEQSHPDLNGSLWQNPADPANGVDDDGNGIVDDTTGADFLRGDGTPNDENGHGSHVSGTVAAVGNNRQGIVGVAYDAKVMALKVLDQDGSGSMIDAVNAINYAIQRNADVINMSWSGPYKSDALYDAIAQAGERGVIVAAAAGNVPVNIDSQTAYPASYNLPNLITVAATNSERRIADFSSYGNSVDIAAPGEDIASTVSGGYQQWNGTSMATPHVSGAVAVLKAARPDASVAEITDALYSTTAPIVSPQSAPISRGRIDLGAATNKLAAAAPIAATPDAGEGAPDTTETDTLAPRQFRLRAPGSRGKVFSPRGSVVVRWSRSHDNVGLSAYYVYIDGKKKKILRDPDGAGPTSARTSVRLRVRAGRHRVRVVAMDLSGNRRVATRKGKRTATFSVARRR